MDQTNPFYDEEAVEAKAYSVKPTPTYTGFEDVVGAREFSVRTSFTGSVFINGKYYRQCCFTANQIALAIEDYLNGVPADNEDCEEEE